MKGRAILGVLSLFLLLAGCNTDKRNIERLQTYAVRYPTDFKVLANTLDPCFNISKIKSDTVTVKGKADTVNIPGSVSYSISHDTVTKTITLSGRQVTIPYFTTIRDTIPDIRQISALQATLATVQTNATEAQTKLSDAQDLAKKRLYWIIGLGVLIGGIIIWKVYSLFTGGAITKII